MIEFIIMRRRRFLRSLFQTATVCAGTRLFPDHSAYLLAAGQHSHPSPRSQFNRPQLALTMDDPSVELGSYMHWEEANHRILDALNQRKLRAALFVCGMRVDRAEGRELLQAWNDAGHLL